MSGLELHEFVPFPITKDDKPGHVCKGGCYCSACGLAKGDRAVHLQNRDRRRVSHGPTAGEQEAPAERDNAETMELRR